MQRRAFSLVELLVVVAIVVLLASLLVPSFQTAKALGRKAVCASNLHHIGQAFQASALHRNANNTRPYPEGAAWPGVPQDAVSEPEIYFCPEGDRESHEADRFAIFLHAEERNGTMGIYVPFANTSSGSGLCEVIPRDGYDEYWFDDGSIEDVDDFLFHVTRDSPRVATFMKSNPGGTRQVGTPSGQADRIVSLRFWNQDVPGWERLRQVPGGKQITLISSGPTNYGINALASNTSPASHTVLLLDYQDPVANAGEDTAARLTESARHLGRLNVLFADQSVRTMSPIELDPLMYPEIWSP